MSGALTRRAAAAQLEARLAAAGLARDEAVLDARALLLAAERISRADLVLEPEAPLSPPGAARLAAYAERRAAREPTSRILGTRGFWTLDLVVEADVLDPRADTETLVEAALDHLRARRGETLSILDLGSGSGAILCALLAELPRARGVAVDVSAAACAATRKNLMRCGLADRAAVLRGRWGDSLRARFDLIVSNPPYIPRGDIAGLDPEVRAHDPILALDGGLDGLDAYRAIARAAPALLAGEGVLALECGLGQSAETARLLARDGLEIREIRRDCGGRERVVVAGRKA
jgi:release factor glutamine methyltransferase